MGAMKLERGNQKVLGGNNANSNAGRDRGEKFLPLLVCTQYLYKAATMPFLSHTRLCCSWCSQYFFKVKNKNANSIAACYRGEHFLRSWCTCHLVKTQHKECELPWRLSEIPRTLKHSWFCSRVSARNRGFLKECSEDPRETRHYTGRRTFPAPQ